MFAINECIAYAGHSPAHSIEPDGVPCAGDFGPQGIDCSLVFGCQTHIDSSAVVSVLLSTELGDSFGRLLKLAGLR